MTDNIRYELREGVAVVTMDDGKANAISHANIEALGEALTRAEGEAGAVLLTGREGRMSAGFDMSVMTGGIDGVRELVTEGAELLLRMYMHPQPLVAACSGHALAAGALLLLASDLRIGAKGNFKIGLNEVAIGMTLPIFGVELARARLSPRHYTRAVTQSRIFDPDTAVEAGFLDSCVEPSELMTAGFAAAKKLSDLSPGAFKNTKAHERRATAEFIRSTLADDMAAIGQPG